MKKIAFLMFFLALPVYAGPLVLELYESQGCSSCPPAEKVLHELENEFGTQILPLSFHVDYWDRLGWKDPFSSAEATKRQQGYGNVLKQSSIYTPELIIQGETGLVGSDRGKARREIQTRLHQPAPDFPIQAKGSRESRSLTVAFQLPETLAPFKPDVTVVIYENADSVNVKKGENAGTLMSGRYAVRDFWTIPGRSSSIYQIPVQLKSAWNAAETGIAVLVQGPTSQILAAQRFFPVSEALH